MKNTIWVKLINISELQNLIFAQIDALDNHRLKSMRQFTKSSWSNIFKVFYRNFRSNIQKIAMWSPCGMCYIYNAQLNKWNMLVNKITILQTETGKYVIFIR